MISLMYTLAIVFLYLGFFTLNWLGSSHWAYYPTIFVTFSMVTLHLLGALLHWLRNNKNANKAN